MENELIYKIKLGKNILDFTEENLNKLPNKTRKFLKKEYEKLSEDLTTEKLAKLQSFKVKFKPIITDEMNDYHMGNKLHTKQGICCIIVSHLRYTLFSLEDLSENVCIKNPDVYDKFPTINAPLRDIDKYVQTVLKTNLIYDYSDVYETDGKLIVTDYKKLGSRLVFVFKNRQIDLEYFHYMQDFNLYRKLDLNLAGIQEIGHIRGYYRLSRNGNSTFQPTPNGNNILLRIVTLAKDGVIQNEDEDLYYHTIKNKGLYNYTYIVKEVDSDESKK